MLPQNRFGYLDGVRGLAIAAVICVHWGYQYTPIGGGGYLGVDVFFVLSGFVITMVLWRSRETGSLPTLWWSFIVRRVRRLYPALVGLAVLGPALWAVTPGTPLPVSTVVERAGLVLAQVTWVGELDGVMDPFRQTWSLGIEWLFYLVWPVVLMSAKRRGVRPLQLAKASAVVALALYAGSALLLDTRVFYFLPPARFGQILVGAALALWFVERPPTVRSRPRGQAVLALSLVAFIVYVLIGPGPFGNGPRIVGVPLATTVAVLLIHHGYATTAGPVHRFLGSGPVTGLGRISYSLYLWHWLPLFLLDKDELGLPLPVVGLIGLTLVALMTTLSYRFLELPFMRSRSDALAPRTPAIGGDRTAVT
ncbi:acyltransferase [Nocardioides sp.]|uniref:acyltransferase family protein n=1 Tax=Nocardioides sp. TaxID=35761 RepID=UPI00286A4089|nr:acyltransferase [Nocardioides sp.]